LEKLLSVKSFDGSIDPLAHYQIILHASLNGFNFPFVVWIVALTFLGCWALIAHTCHSFPTRWSPYSFKCSNTCWNQHFPTLNGTMRCSSHVTLRCTFSCPTFWELSGLVLTPIVGFFGELLTWAQVCFLFSRCSFKYCISTSLFMCRSRGKRLVINSSYHTNISFIIGPFSYNITYWSWFATSFSCPPFMVSMWSYHWQSRYPFASMPIWEWMYS
jgi:hypothetical protein